MSDYFSGHLNILIEKSITIKGRKFTCVDDSGDSMDVGNELQTMPVSISGFKCNTIALRSVCIATVFVPKVESGERADVPKVELGEQRVKDHFWCYTCV